MSARTEVLAQVTELRYPLVISEDRSSYALEQIKEGNYFAPINRFKVTTHSQDVTPEALLKCKKRYALLISEAGDGIIEVFNGDDCKEEYEVGKNGIIYFKEDVKGKYDEGDGKRFVRIYSIVELTKNS